MSYFSDKLWIKRSGQVIAFWIVPVTMHTLCTQYYTLLEPSEIYGSSGCTEAVLSENHAFWQNASLVHDSKTILDLAASLKI